MKTREKVKCLLCGGVMRLAIYRDCSSLWKCVGNASHIMTLPEYSDLYFGMRGRGPNPEKLSLVIESMKKRAEEIF